MASKKHQKLVIERATERSVFLLRLHVFKRCRFVICMLIYTFTASFGSYTVWTEANLKIGQRKKKEAVLKILKAKITHS